VEAEADARRRRIFDRLYHSLENGRRELDGRELLPELPYTPLDREIDAHTLSHTIPALRERSPGWRTGDGAALLDQMEGELLPRLTEGDDDD
jgi:hypothetical protein